MDEYQTAAAVAIASLKNKLPKLYMDFKHFINFNQIINSWKKRSYFFN